MFLLYYKNIVIGSLSISNDIWTFIYSDDFKNQSEISPIIDFSNVNKIYKWSKLPPFFSIRIPSLKRNAVLKILEESNIDKNDEVELLKKFGHKSICNPYVLKYVT